MTSLLRQLFTARRDTTEQVFEKLSSDTELARESVDLVVDFLRKLRSNSYFARHVVRRIFRATSTIQRFVRCSILHRTAIIYRVVENWTIHDAESNLRTNIDQQLRLFVVRNEYQKQRYAFRAQWRSWRKQLRALYLQRDLAIQDREKTAATTGSVAADRVSFFNVRIAQLESNEPRWQFMIDNDVLMSHINMELRKETSNKMESVIRTLGIKCNDSHFVNSLVERYEGIMAKARKPVKPLSNLRRATSLGGRSLAALQRQSKKASVTKKSFTGKIDLGVAVKNVLSQVFGDGAETTSSHESSTPELRSPENTQKKPEVYSLLGIDVPDEQLKTPEGFNLRVAPRRDSAPLRPTEGIDAPRRSYTIPTHTSKIVVPYIHEIPTQTVVSRAVVKLANTRTPRPPSLQVRETHSASLRRQSARLNRERATFEFAQNLPPRDSGGTADDIFYPYSTASCPPEYEKDVAMERKNRAVRLTTALNAAQRRNELLEKKEAYARRKQAIRTETANNPKTSWWNDAPSDTRAMLDLALTATSAAQYLQDRKNRKVTYSFHTADPMRTLQTGGHSDANVCLLVPRKDDITHPHLFAVGEWNGTIRIFSSGNYHHPLIVDEHQERVTALASAMNGDCIASGSDDCKIFFFMPRNPTGSTFTVAPTNNIHNQAWIKSWSVTHESHVLALTGLHRSFFASACFDCDVHIHDADAQATVRRLKGHTLLVTALCPLLDDHHHLATGSLDGSVRIWRLDDLVVSTRVSTTQPPTAQSLVTHNQERTIESSQSRLFPSYGGWIMSVVSITGAQTIICLSGDGYLRVFDAVTLETITSIKCGPFSRAPRIQAVGSALVALSDNTDGVRFFNIFNGQILFEVQVPVRGERVVALHSLLNGHCLIGTSLGFIYAVDCEKGTIASRVRGHSKALVAFSGAPGPKGGSAGSMVLSVARDNTLCVILAETLF